MKTWVVTRHKGALDWLLEEGVAFDTHIEHLDSSQLQSGDRVIGNLPIPMVADLNSNGVDYWHLAFSVPFELRGVELSAAQLRELGITLKAYHVSAL
jgi:CRISPR-associated protein Csx16